MIGTYIQMSRVSYGRHDSHESRYLRQGDARDTTQFSYDVQLTLERGEQREKKT